MFESQLSETLQRIFDVPKVSFDKPADTREQNVLFVEIQKATTQTKTTGKAKGRVTGSVFMFAPNNKLTFGFFNRQLHKADASDTKPFYFYNMDESEKTQNNLVIRKCDFIYFFSKDFDPDQGSLTSIDLSIGGDDE